MVNHPDIPLGRDIYTLSGDKSSLAESMGQGRRWCSVGNLEKFLVYNEKGLHNQQKCWVNHGERIECESIKLSHFAAIFLSFLIDKSASRLRGGGVNAGTAV